MRFFIESPFLAIAILVIANVISFCTFNDFLFCVKAASLLFELLFKVSRDDEASPNHRPQQ